jgi:subtilisin family serine protease
MNQNRADAINFVAQEAPANLIRRYVINCSWKTGGDHAGVRTAIQTAVNTNIVVVFAAGNANTNMDVKPEFPGVYPEVISVTSVDNRDRKPWLSNFGSTVDVAAPGENIFSTLPGGGHGFDSGTSMAAPHVAGLAALIWSVDSSLTNQQVRHVIETTCDNVDATNPGFVGMLGRGRVNAAAAVRRLKTTVPNVRERPPSTASKMVAAAHLVPKFVYLPGPTGPQAWVSHQSPHAGAKVDVGSTVTLTIRKGRKP